MDQVRSRLTLVGPKPYQERGELVVTAAVDPAVVDDGNSFNHLGYDCDAAWVDTQFSLEDYSLRAAGALFPTLRTPFLAVNLTSWYQPDIYPLDKIMVSSAKLGLSGIPLIVLSARSASPPGGPAFSQITGLHFLPE